MGLRAPRDKRFPVRRIIRRVFAIIIPGYTFHGPIRKRFGRRR